jgi:hypothetical protein
MQQEDGMQTATPLASSVVLSPGNYNQNKTYDSSLMHTIPSLQTTATNDT